MEFHKDRNFDLKGIFYVKGHYRVYHTPLLRNNPRREKGKVSRKRKKGELGHLHTQLTLSKSNLSK